MSRVLASPDRFAVSAFDALLANIAILDREGMIIAVNLAWAQFAQQHSGPGADLADLQATRDGSIGLDYLSVCDATTGDDRPYAVQIARQIRTVLHGGPGGETEYPCRLPDGLHHFMARVSGFTQDGERYAVVAHEDITRRKLAELEVFRLNRDLEARVQERGQQLLQQNHALEQAKLQLEANVQALVQSNLALAQYAHVASHDLQEPLRTIGSFAGLLLATQGDRLDERGQFYARNVIEGAERLKRLIQDLLSFAKVRAEQLEFAPVDMTHVTHAVLATLEEEVGRCAAHVTVAPLPPVLGRESLITQLLFNLMQNALKFCRDDLTLHLNVYAEPQGDFVRFTVEDNGIGIAPEYQEQVFVIFQRLHGRARYQGNGLGLAICRKIVQGMGGEIWLESDVGVGTTVHLRLPLASGQTTPQPSST